MTEHVEFGTPPLPQSCTHLRVTETLYMQSHSTIPTGNELFDHILEFCCFVERSKQNLHFLLSFFLIKHRDKIATGSFDKTCKLWCAETGKCFHTFCGHRAEIVGILNLNLSVTVCFFLSLKRIKQDQ